MSDEKPDLRRDPRAARDQRRQRASETPPAEAGAASAPVQRIDPRAARAQRLQRAADQPAPVAGSADATTARRVDPRATRDQRRQTPATPDPAALAAVPVLRRDPRAGARQRSAPAPQEAIATVSPGPAITRIENPANWCLVVPDARDGALSSHDRDVLAAARQTADRLGGGVIAFAPSGAADFGTVGVDRLVSRQQADGFAPGQAVAQLAALVSAHQPAHVFLPESVTGGGHLGRLLAARLGERVASNVIRLAGDEATRRADGGRSDETLALPRIVLVAAEAATPDFKDRREARLLEIAAAPAREAIRDGGRLALDASDMPLAEADFIVSGGVGVSEWQRFLAVAKALGATVGCSRAVCDAGHLPRSRQVGASGTLVDPRCYLAFGISGAPQHLQGIARCERVIAVNTDLHAEMIKRAQLAIVADAQPVMASLLELLERADA
jgi:electron transfer flavoprotein alpha subunit